MSIIYKIKDDLGLDELTYIFDNLSNIIEFKSIIYSIYGVNVSLATIKRIMCSIGYKWNYRHKLISMYTLMFDSLLVRVCEKCGKEFTKASSGSYRFCSSLCSHSYSSTHDPSLRLMINKKISNSLKGRKDKRKCERKGYHLSDESKNKISKSLKDYYKSHKVAHKSGYHLTDLHKNKISNSLKLKWKLGELKGWPSRNKHKRSYAESFWEKVLINNNINYEYEKKVAKKYELGINESGSYFLDFCIDGFIDLEIDGGQHDWEDRKLHDKIRDERLSSAGYIIYRIRFINPKSNNGINLVKSQIDNFLDWYKSLKSFTNSNL